MLCVRGCVRGVAAAAMVVVALSAACSSPTGPTPAPQGLTIVGALVLTPGLTTQLTVTSTPPSSAAVVWQSKTPAVATVSPTGLVMAVSVGTAVVTAAAGGATAQASIIVEPADATTTTVSGCQYVVMPGRYVLSIDLPARGTPCLIIMGVASVAIDCAGHAVGDIVVNNASAVTISNCTITDSQPVGMASVNGVTIDHCALTSPDAVGLRVTSGWNVAVVQDTVATSQNGTAASIWFSGGGNNRVINSTLTGGYDGGEDESGTDDGVVIQNETNDTIQGNTISQMFDMGVEGAGAVGNTLIADNTFTANGITGVGALYCTSWTNDVVRDNIVTQTPTLAFFGYQTGAFCGATQLPGMLVNNQFVGNVFSTPAQGGFTGPFVRARMDVNGPATVMGNLLQGNDFGPNDGPSLTPLSGFIDGGGNICGPLNPALSNFVCTGSTVSLSGWSDHSLGIRPLGERAEMRMPSGPRSPSCPARRDLWAALCRQLPTALPDARQLLAQSAPTKVTR
jgi:hypothetical protein